MTVQPAAAERAGGRPRNPELDRAILDAVLELLGEEGYERMSIESVAQRAGVGKPTIYRRWASKQAMVIEALSHLGDAMVTPADGTVRQRLTSLVEHLWSGAARAHADRTTVLSNLVGEIHRSPELRDAVQTTFVANRRRQVMELLEEGIAAGEIAPTTDLEVAADLVISPLLARKIITGGKISAAFGRRIVDMLFDGVGTRAANRKPTG
jgi:AcrR family transcriptional regulator